MKRLLLLDHPQFTSATHFLWQGLKSLERQYPDHLSVSCYPFIPTHYDDDQFDLKNLAWFNWLSEIVEQSRGNPARLSRGIPPFSPGETLTSEGVTVLLRAGYGRRFAKTDLLEDEEKAVRELNSRKFDAVVLGNSHRVPTILLARLRERVPNFPPIVYLDAGERDELNEHWIHVFRPAVVFKQILTPEVRAKGMSVAVPGYRLQIYPLPLSSPMVDDPEAQVEGLSIQFLRDRSMVAQKMLPVFYAMGATWGQREAAVKAVDDLVLRRNFSRIKACSYANYHFVLSMSRLAVTMRGSGRDTTRYWEIPLYRTAMIADGTMGCIHPYPFEDRKTAFFYRTTDELVHAVDHNLTNAGDASEEADRVAVAGHWHLERYHSATARAVFFLDILAQEMNFCDAGLRESLAAWKALKRWDGRPWEGPVV